MNLDSLKRSPNELSYTELYDLIELRRESRFTPKPKHEKRVSLRKVRREAKNLPFDQLLKQTQKMVKDLEEMKNGKD